MRVSTVLYCTVLCCICNVLYRIPSLLPQMKPQHTVSKGSHHGRKAAYLRTLSGRGGGGDDQFCTFWGDFCMCVEITNRLNLVLKHLTLVPRYRAYIRSW